MSSTQAKRLEDLPHFHVSGTKQGDTHPTGYIDFELSGTFDRIDGITEGRCWLLLPERDCLIGDLKSLDPEARTAIFFTSEESIPNLAGSSLPYLDGRWQAYHVWMVIEPEWIWNRVLFQAKDASARRFEADQVSIIDGQEVKEWVEIRKIGAESEGARYYPIFPSGQVDLPDAGPDGVIRGGWSHEHCELCRDHINSGQYGFLDRSEHRVCEKCYNKYVSAHDLSFLDSA